MARGGSGGRGRRQGGGCYRASQTSDLARRRLATVTQHSDGGPQSRSSGGGGGAKPVVLWPLPKDKELWPLPKDTEEEESKQKYVERKASCNGMEETPFYRLAVRAQPAVGSSAISLQQAALDKRRLTNLLQNVLPEVPLLSDIMGDQDSSHLDQDSPHLQPPPSTKASPVLLHPPTSLPPNRVRVFY